MAWFSLSQCLFTKEDILKHVGNRASLGNSLITNFLQNIFLCVQQNKDIHTGLEILEDE